MGVAGGIEVGGWGYSLVVEHLPSMHKGPEFGSQN
jgi:hypothetical protein